MISWRTLLDCTEAGPKPNEHNAVAVLQHDPMFGPDRIWFDEFLGRYMIANSPTRELRDDDDTGILIYMQSPEGPNIAKLSESAVSRAIRYVARQRTRHCVREYLDTLEWDRIPRIAHAFEDFWGAETSETQPCDYLRTVSANYFLSLVARVRQPGCKADHMPVFEGTQGIGKERALTALGREWYMVTQYRVTQIDFLRSLPGKWIVEIGEMHSFSRAEKEDIKLAVSTPRDRYRTPNARHAHDAPRQCIFAGTTNRDDWGNDDTGLRRFWPVRCGLIDVDRLAAARDQLFAEADWLHSMGVDWWSTPVSTFAVQADRQAGDIWTDAVLTWCTGKPDVGLAEIARDALKMRDADMTRLHELRIGSILRLAGWTKKPIRRDGKLTKRWIPDT